MVSYTIFLLDCQRDGILGETGGEDDDLKVLGDLLYERDTAWSDQYEDVAGAALDVDRQHDVGLVGRGEGGVDQGLVNVEQQRLAPAHRFFLRVQQSVTSR